MDGSTLFALVAALAVGLAVGALPLLGILRASRALRAARRLAADSAAGSGSAPADPGDLNPYELALLCGGPVRVGETAVTDAFLHGRVRQRTSGGFFTLVGPSRPYTHEKSPVRRDLVKAFKNRVGVSAREMVRRVVHGKGVQRIRSDLARAGLIIDSDQLRHSLRARGKAAGAIRWMRTLAVFVAVGGVGGFLLMESVTIPLALLTAGLACAAVLVAAQAVVAATGGPALLPNTPAGDAVVALARERYGLPSGRTSDGGRASDAMTRDRAVRSTAVTGFLGLRRSASSAGARHLRSGTPRTSSTPSSDSGSASVDNVLYASHPGAVAEAEPESRPDLIDLDGLCAFADLCQDPPGSGAGGGTSGDGGWSGGFPGTGGGSSGSGDSGGGWGGGGDSGGGGGDGGGGGGE
ncbi:TIGR04222 domain-containing membrane protein [Nocardiopsis sp. FR6]|uniref:TIGR04222 domain-containing membrane protein n=1 Tax=Nocardiopsis sp. FR6 TaxID=2605986 RepID=UPI001359DE4A|nr:TIGR04222 domain-containing membrane protein [Nocardiopsis sp. FR6]